MSLFPNRRSLATLALGSLVLTSFACEKLESDQLQGDRLVKASADAGVKARRGLPTTQSLTAALSELQKAANVSQASTTSKIRARSLEAQTELDLGNRVAADLRALYPAISRHVWEIGQAAIRVKQVNDAIAALNATEPKVSQKAVADKRGEMVAAGEAATAKATKLQADIDKINAQAKDWQTQKDAAFTAADTDAASAAKLTGKQASDLLDKAAESRRKGGNLGHDIDKLSGGLFALERDLAAANLDKKTADDAVAALDARKKALDDEWAATQAEVKKHQDAAKAIGGDISAKATALADLNKRADVLRKAASDRFRSAAEHNASAAKDASTLMSDLGKWTGHEKYSQSVEKQAWEKLKQIYSPGNFKLREAAAWHAQAEIFSEQLAQAQAQQKLGTEIGAPLGAAQVAVPATLTDLAAAQKAAADASGKAFTSAAERYRDAAEGGGAPREVQQAARIDRIFALFGQYLNGDASKLPEAKSAYDAAFNETERQTDPLAKMIQPIVNVKG